jgi:flavin-dependent dehydrogenase
MMISTDVLIIGGGPAGASCASRLRDLGIDCRILDQARFPRFKPCAGWITPQVLSDIRLDPNAYIHAQDGQTRSFTTLTSSRISIFNLSLNLPSNQYAIRRYEFDAWLLERSGAPVHEHAVRSIVKRDGQYIVDDQYSANYLVGAGGTNCPVYRTLFKATTPHKPGDLIVAQEEEFPYPHRSNQCWLWFFKDRLPGYAWFVPKANGFVNVGIGGKIERLKAHNDNLKDHWNRFIAHLEQIGLVRGHAYKPSGHSYFLRQPHHEPHRDNAYLVGDAAGLATLDMGEGIGPAIRSGFRAAEAIARGSEYKLDNIASYSEPTGFLISWLMNR